MADDIMKKAMQKVMDDMGKTAKSFKAKKFEKKKPMVLDEMKIEGKAPSDGDGDEVKLSPVEGGLTLGGIMSKPGNSGADIAKTSDLTPEELDEIMKGAK